MNIYMNNNCQAISYLLSFSYPTFPTIFNQCFLLPQGHMDEDVQAALLQIIRMRQGLVC